MFRSAVGFLLALGGGWFLGCLVPGVVLPSQREGFGVRQAVWLRDSVSSMVSPLSWRPGLSGLPGVGSWSVLGPPQAFP